MIRKKAAASLDPWFEHSRTSLVTSFANGIVKDLATVRAAIVSPWSNGQTEGKITEFKLVKRQICGRAKLDLLEARLVGAVRRPPSPKVRQSPASVPIHRPEFAGCKLCSSRLTMNMPSIAISRR